MNGFAMPASSQFTKTLITMEDGKNIEPHTSFLIQPILYLQESCIMNSGRNQVGAISCVNSD